MIESPLILRDQEAKVAKVAKQAKELSLTRPLGFPGMAAASRCRMVNLVVSFSIALKAATTRTFRLVSDAPEASTAVENLLPTAQFAVRIMPCRTAPKLDISTTGKASSASVL